MEATAFFRKRDRTGGAIEQANAQPRLQPGYCAAHARLRHVEQLTGRGKATGGDDGREHTHAIQNPLVESAHDATWS